MFIFYNYIGNSCNTINVNNMQIKQPVKFSIARLAGADKDTFQRYGVANREFTVKGIARSLDEEVFLETLVGNTGSIDCITTMSGRGTEGDFLADDFLSDDFNTDDIASTSLFTSNVFYLNLNWSDIGNRPLERQFTIDIVEVK